MKEKEQWNSFKLWWSQTKLIKVFNLNLHNINAAEEKKRVSEWKPIRNDNSEKSNWLLWGMIKVNKIF